MVQYGFTFFCGVSLSTRCVELLPLMFCVGVCDRMFLFPCFRRFLIVDCWLVVLGHVVCSCLIVGYFLAVNDMFVRRGLQPPFNPYSPGNKPAVIMQNYEKLEVIPNKSNPLTVEMIAEMSDYA